MQFYRFYLALFLNALIVSKFFSNNALSFWEDVDKTDDL